MKAIICDIDGTLIDTRAYDRDFLAGKISRHQLYELSDLHAPPIAPVINFLQQAAAKGHPIYYVTGRPHGTPHNILPARLQLPRGTLVQKPANTSSIAHKHTAAAHILQQHRTAHVLDDNPEHIWGYTQLDGITTTLIPGWDKEQHNQPIIPILPKVENI